MYLYLLSPIDHGWESLPKVNMQKPSKRFQEVLEVARKHLWEGDFTEVPRIMTLPPDKDGYEFAMAYIWKQDNNGTTFIASEVPLTYLGDPEYEWIV